MTEIHVNLSIRPYHAVPIKYIQMEDASVPITSIASIMSAVHVLITQNGMDFTVNAIIRKIGVSAVLILNISTATASACKDM
jgi:hypothetical protein